MRCMMCRYMRAWLMECRMCRCVGVLMSSRMCRYMWGY